MMLEISSALLVVGAALMLLAAIGLLRMPDLYTRMHATSKAGTLGASLMLVAAMLAYGTVDIVMRAMAAIGFLIVTAPIAAHVIGRAGYRTGTVLWDGTLLDELRDATRQAPPRRE